jgi:flagellar assembly factor FliW
MKKLKLKLWRIENVILMKVLQQDESTRDRDFGFSASNGMSIFSDYCPDIDTDGIYINGENRNKDNIMSVCECETDIEAIATINNILLLVKEYNESISNTETQLTEKEDIHTFIAE